MSCACAQHIFISIEHASHRFTSPKSGITENHGQSNKKINIAVNFNNFLGNERFIID